jgi:hypothetical protein
MLRNVIGTAAVLAFFVTAVHAAQDRETLLEKKASLTQKDPAYKPGAGVDKLTDGDAQQVFMAVNNNPHQVFMLKLKKGDKVLFELTSDDFDTVVIVEDPKKTVLAFNDDAEEGTLNSRLEWTVPADDEYRIIVVAFGDEKQVGAFNLKVTKAK